MPITAVVGEQRGDEGKGRLVDMLAEEYDIVARFNGGPNAGHTIVLSDGEEFKFHGLPSGFANEHTVNAIGRGVSVDAVKLSGEIDQLMARGIEVGEHNLKICSAARLILPHHVSLDQIREKGAGRQGTTQSGIAPTASDKSMRISTLAEAINKRPTELRHTIQKELTKHRRIRERLELDPLDEASIADKYVESALRLGTFTTDVAFFLNQELDKANPARVLAEGAQGFLLDVDHGMIPFTTSSSTTSGGVSPGLGVPPTKIDTIIGVAKAIQSHVGDGPFVTEIHEEGNEELLTRLHGDKTSIDAEVGTTTGRTRRLGYLDLPQLRRAQTINGSHELALTKLDWVPRYGEYVLICEAHQRKGRNLSMAADTAAKLEESRALYALLPTWEVDIQDVRKFADLPENAQNYITFIEERTKAPITRIGVGPRRDQVILRPVA